MRVFPHFLLLAAVGCGPQVSSDPSEGRPDAGGPAAPGATEGDRMATTFRQVGSRIGPPAETAGPKTTAIRFGDATVPLADASPARHLTVTITLQVTAAAEPAVAARLAERKAEMSVWLHTHLAAKTPRDVTGTIGVARLQREIQERFEEFLAPDGDSGLRAVQFDEFVVR